jgi:hypothetical protein
MHPSQLPTMSMSQRRVYVRLICAELGINIVSEGGGFRLVGDRVCLFVDDLAHVRPHELEA